jgi:tellurite resistance protein
MSEREFIQQLPPEQVDALVEIMFLAAESDGDVSAEEISALAATTERVTNGAVSKAQAERSLEKARQALAASSRPERLEAIKGALQVEQRRHALLLAIQVTATDGVIRTSERELILEVAEALEIDGATAADLVRAVER